MKIMLKTSRILKTLFETKVRVVTKKSYPNELFSDEKSSMMTSVTANNFEF